MKLYLVRHGSTRENEEKRYLGWTDAGLSAHGEEQAKRLAAYFQGRVRPPFSLYSSDLKRAARTAEIIGSQHGLKPIESPLLRELNFGKWEGLTWKQIARAYPKEYRRWLQDPGQHHPPEGEGLLEMKERTGRFLERLLQTGRPGQNILVVAHGGIIRLSLLQLLTRDEKDFWNLDIKTASVSLLRKWEGRFQPVYINRTV